MAVTALKISSNGKDNHLLVTTIPTGERECFVQIFMSDDTYMNKGQIAKQFDIDKTELQYHIDLRKDSNDAGHLVAEFCTNPEWNPPT